MPARNDGMRGLAVFISDIRNSKSKEAEVKRINKELANIRSKFKGDKNLDGYQKKKYVCKLLFIFLLGHDIDFGHMEAVNLLSSNKYTEKQIGYLFISILVSTGNDLIKLIVQAIHNDIASRCHIFAVLALHCIANINSVEMVESFREEIPKLLVAAGTTDAIKQSCALCILRLMHNSAADQSTPALDLSEWSSRIMQLLNDSHMGVVTSSASLLQALAKINPNQYRGSISLAVSRLSTIVTSAHSDLQDYSYYFVPAPWLTVKLLQLLQSFTAVALLEDTGTKNRLTECLSILLERGNEAPKSKKVQHTNARNAVLFEAINLIVHLDHDSDLLVKSSTLLGQFLQNRETNLRYLALESLCLIATSEFSHDSVKQHQETVISALKTEYDVSVRQRAADLLYAMCDKSNVEQIVEEMLLYLEVATFSIREEMVLKVAILAEKYAVDYTWYVDTILNLIRVAGDHVSEEVWYRVIQIVVNQEEVQGYAAKTVFEALQAPACHENMVKVGGYIMGEFGNLIALDPRSSPDEQFRLLHSKFPLCSPATRQLLLSSYVKFANLFPEMKPTLQEVFTNENHCRSSDVELQQRAVEYAKLSAHPSADVLAIVLEEMPPFPEKETSLLLMLKKRKTDQSGSNLPGTLASSAADGVTNEALSSPSWRDPPETTTVAQPVTAISDLLGLDSAVESSTAAAAAATASVAAAATNTASVAGAADAAGSSKPVVTDQLTNYLAAAAADKTSAAASAIAASASASRADTAAAINSDDLICQFLCKNQGVLYEDAVIQLGMKCEYRQSVGQLRIFYGNKSPHIFTELTATIQMSAELSTQLRVQAGPVQNNIPPGGQMEQIINAQCIQHFSDSPQLLIKFKHNLTEKVLQIRIPITLNKFMHGMQMDSGQFYQKWKLLNQPNQEFTAVVKPRQSLEAAVLRSKLESFGFTVLDGIDPNAENLVSISVVSTQRAIGCMARLEPSRQAQMYRLTLRANTDGVAKLLSQLLQTLI